MFEMGCLGICAAAVSKEHCDWNRPSISHSLPLTSPLPLSLFSPQRADATTPWKEFVTPEGRKYFYNKVTKQSKWTIPEDLKVRQTLNPKP